jgi:tRNAThr (cytosine32-N3)-methyltransferase
LQQEFPILSAATAEDYGPVKVVELGCGAGNTLFPVVQQNRNPHFHIHGCDFAANAVKVVKEQPLYREHHEKGTISASVYDLSAPDTLPEDVVPGSIDVVIMVFVFSALAPDQWIPALRNVRRMLKPGGKVLFRDYGRGDLAQVRFKSGRYLDENFYIRGDGTRVYFFEESQLGEMFTGKSEGTPDLPGWDAEDGYGGFKVESLATDKRMIVNRTRQIKMHRRWLQAVFEKL